jgi:hypothetical protein
MTNDPLSIIDLSQKSSPAQSKLIPAAASGVTPVYQIQPAELSIDILYEI